MKKMALSLLAIAGLFVVGCGFVAEYTYPQKTKDWTPEMRQAAPDKFAALAEKEIKADLATIEERTVAIRKAASQLNNRFKKSSEELAFAKKLAKELVAAKQTGKFPVKIEITGLEYEEFQLDSQMELLFGQLKVYKSTLQGVKEASALLEKEKLDLKVRATETKGRLDMLQAQVEIYKARQVSREGLALLDDCASLLLDNETFFANSDPVLGVEELMMRAEKVAADQESEFDLGALLAELGDEEETETAEAVTKAQDFGGLEEFLDDEEEAETEVETEGKGKGTKDLETTLDEEDIPEEPAN